ncbi:MAG: hypothetical protein AAGA60_31565 [Cyanobacteria bacterium P01_E01_bin.42]
MKAIALAHDPGGANAVAATVAALRSSGAIVEAYAKGPAIRQFQRLQVTCTPIENPHLTLWSQLEGDILIAGTSQYDCFEVEGIARAKEKNIPSLAIMDYWGNYRQRFERSETVWPDWIAAIDETCAAGIVAEGFRRDRIHITGQPYFAWLLAHRPTQLRRQPNPPRRILFASQPNANEISILKTVIEVLQDYPPLEQLLIRFHPRQGKCRESLELLARSGLPHAVDESLDVLSTLQKQDIVLGITSIILVEAALMGVSTGSLAIGVQNTLRSNDYGITTLLKSAEELRAFLDNNDSVRIGKQFLVQQENADNRIYCFCYDIVRS